jgi:hypothetical protein
MKIVAMVLSGSLAGLMAAPSPAVGEPAATGGKPLCNPAAGTVSFRPASAKVDKAGRETLNQVATWVKEEDGRKVEVEAYADAGNETKNPTSLSDKRARAVENYLRGKGVDAERVAAYGRGDAVPAGLAAATDSSRLAVVTTCEPAPTPPAAAAAPEPTPAPVVQEAPPPPPPVEAMPSPGDTSPSSSMPPPAEEGVHASGEEPAPMSGIGMAVTAGGGVTGFVGSGARASADPGFTWDARLTLGTRTIIGLDLAYLGATQGLDIKGLDTDALLLSNGGEADLRLQVPKGIARPYLFGGIGWTHYKVTRTQLGGTGLAGGDTVGTVPFGIGLAIGRPNGIVFDLRATGRVTFDEQLLNGVAQTQGSTNLNSWGVVARVGGEF